MLNHYELNHILEELKRFSLSFHLLILEWLKRNHDYSFVMHFWYCKIAHCWERVPPSWLLFAPALVAHSAVPVWGRICGSGCPRGSAALRLRWRQLPWCLLSSHVAEPRPSPTESGSQVPEPQGERKTQFWLRNYVDSPTSVFSPAFTGLWRLLLLLNVK